tara:strand:- start:36890 stop:37411 length:522 start_codon:yes stop_codon:yes gene_type:complete
LPLQCKPEVSHKPEGLLAFLLPYRAGLNRANRHGQSINMRPVFQTEFEEGRGNALQACVSSLLELSLEDVPNFIEFADYRQTMNEWLAKRGLAFLRVDLVDGELPYSTAPGLGLLLAGKSPRGDHRHVILAATSAEGFQMLHDPHPSGAGIHGNALWAGFLIPLAIAGDGPAS